MRRSTARAKWSSHSPGSSCIEPTVRPSRSILPTTRAIDLIKLQNGITSALTQDAAVPAGNYDWMRLKVLASKNSQGESYIRMLNGAQYPLWIPSGAEIRSQAESRVHGGAGERDTADHRLRSAQVDSRAAGAGPELHHEADPAHQRSAPGRQARRHGGSRSPRRSAARAGLAGVRLQGRALSLRRRRGDAGRSGC